MCSIRTTSLGAAGAGIIGLAALAACGVPPGQPHAGARAPAPVARADRTPPSKGGSPEAPEVPEGLRLALLGPDHRTHTAPPPPIVTRAAWHADEKLRDPKARYAHTVKAVFVHHTDSGNGYTCAKAPDTLRSISDYHFRERSWADIGYNFLVDKCGTIYEGRAGGISKPVIGAHTSGFNDDTMGIAAIGTFGTGTPLPKAMISAIAALTAWKLGLRGIDPRGRTRLRSTNDDSRYPKGSWAVLNVVSGHRDSYFTDCPGAALYARLPAIRAETARLQGRS